jgi:phosphoribosyl 1,2-cyclic phosphodiesterase
VVTLGSKNAGQAADLEVRFWGVRGSFPTPVPKNLGYGGNTTCLEIRAGNGARLIVDAGTGLRDLGLEMQSRGEKPEVIRFLFTHFHGDHMHGMPFFMPLYDPGQRIELYSGKPADEAQAAFERLMTEPYFPVDLAKLPGQRRYVELGSAEMEIDGVHVTAFPLNHPQGAWGFRFEYRGAVVVHASDYEHGSPDLERELVEHSRGANVLIYDAQYTPEEYETRRGWGHSTWTEAVQVAIEAGVERLVLFHHDPSHDDAAVDAIVDAARGQFANVIGAREGAVLQISGQR